MKKHFYVVLFALLLGTLSSASAQPANGYVQYDSKITFKPDEAGISADVTLIIPTSLLQNQQLTLLLSKQQSISHISGTQLKSYAIETSTRVPPWNLITLNFEDTQQPSYSVNLKYAGSIDETAGHGNYINKQGAHLSIDSAWHPFVADFATKMTGKVQLTVPTDWELFSPGHQQRLTADSRLVINDMPAIDVVLFAQRAPQIKTVNNVEVIYQGITSTKAQRLADDGSQCLTALNANMSSDNKLARAHLIVLERNGPSFARGHYISMSKASLSTRQADYQYVCHELAHHWTPFANAMSHDYWMMESFAEYISAQQLKRRFGEQAYQQVAERWQQLAKGVGFVWRANTPERASHRVNYGLGPLRLTQLANRIGNKKFDQLLAWYTANDVTETEQLLDKVGEITSATTQAWFTKQLGQGERKQ